MEASILDLRYRMKDVLKALERNEVVKILYHGKIKGKIFPCSEDKSAEKNRTVDHPFYGMHAND